MRLPDTQRPDFRAAARRHGAALSSSFAWFGLAVLFANVAPLPLRAFSCYSELGIVRDVNPDHLARQARETARHLQELGAPLDSWEAVALERAIQNPRAPFSIGTIQQVLDPHVLISLSISPEAEIKASSGPALPHLAIGGWGTFVIKVDNLARVNALLHVESLNAITNGESFSPDRWMRSKLWPDPPTLSGERVDYFLLRVQSEEKGHREALFACFTGLRPLSEPGPLSFNRVPILFSLMNEADLAKARLARLLRHQHGANAAAGKRGPPLGSIRAASCLDCHRAATEVRVSPVQLEKEKSCMACHRELAPALASSNRCSVCGMANCRMNCVARGQTQAGEKMMRMSGVPRPLFFGGVGSVLVVSFGLVEFLNRGARREKKRWRWNLLALPMLAWCFRRRWFKPLLQTPVFALFGFLIYAGFAGDRVVNITPILTWTIWWSGLIFLVLFLGKAWCFLCPWDFAATLLQSVGRLWGSRRPFTLGVRWPAALRNIYLAVGLFILLTWLELGYQVTASPRATAALALVMVALAVVPALLFDKRAFCRYGCLVGRISGLYAMFAPVEVRAANPEICRSCQTRDCLRGNERAPACPTSLLLPAIKENTYCIQCGHCVRSCPSENVAFNVRPFAADLTRFSRPRTDESLLAVILLALTSFHGLTMTPFWDSANGASVIGWLRSTLGVGPLAAFTAGMTAMLVILILFFWLLCHVTRRLTQDTNVSTHKLFLYFAYSLLPVALFYHLAHNAMHFFMEGQYLVPLLSDPLGAGANWFGTAALRPGPLLAAPVIWWLQVGLVLVGHIFGIVIAHHASRKLYAEPHQATLALVPMLGGMVLYSWFSLWILHLDMNMRTTLM